ncbi:MAG: hypothetical protein HeimC3_37670 [Candidatus Heimdallarchaeota archaeon LC_3]|nr:MAG: hypothetical protein HeimC3_50720 [Candidatus Heimdallarchaeota archaeon LC_3]OLS21018.1 MAG: hypothetical protein HeimC3_37670 [Candidatus Heimdallarchaeota archaeon LC_3]
MLNGEFDSPIRKNFIKEEMKSKNTRNSCTFTEDILYELSWKSGTIIQGVKTITGTIITNMIKSISVNVLKLLKAPVR